MSENNIIRTIPHNRFEEPSFKEVSTYLTSKGVGAQEQSKYSFDAFIDLGNAYSHVLFGASINNSFVDLQALYELELITSKELIHHDKIQQLIQNIDFSVISGSSPLDKAFYSYILVQEVLQIPESPNVLDKKKQEKQLEEKINSVKKKIAKEFESSELYKMLLSKLLRLEGFREAAEMGISIKLEEKDIGQVNVGVAISQIKDYCNTLQNLNNDSSIENLILRDHFISPEENLKHLTKAQKNLIEKLAVLKTKGNIKAMIIPAVRKINQMEEVSQVGNLSSFSSMVLPTFQYKLCTNQLSVIQDMPTDKQNLLLLIDDSGSMSHPEKMEWVQAVVYNRLEAVINNKARLIICWFEEYVHRHIIIRTKQEAIKFITSQSFGSFDGGDTDIQRALKDSIKLIKTEFEPDLSKCQIVIINDGQDRINPRYQPEIVTNVFILGKDNYDLKKVVESTTGTYERFM